jgi:hypothetical protein
VELRREKDIPFLIIGVAEFRHYSLVSGDLKSFDMQTIHAILDEIHEVMTMARCTQ